MPNTTVSKIPLPSPADLRRVEAVLGFVFNEFESLQGAFRYPENAADAALKKARREGATDDESFSQAAAVEGAAKHLLDDETAGRLFMFLFDVIDEVERIEEMARDCLERVKWARHDNLEGYDLSERIRIQEAIWELSVDA